MANPDYSRSMSSKPTTPTDAEMMASLAREEAENLAAQEGLSPQSGVPQSDADFDDLLEGGEGPQSVVASNHQSSQPASVADSAVDFDDMLEDEPSESSVVKSDLQQGPSSKVAPEGDSVVRSASHGIDINSGAPEASGSHLPPDPDSHAAISDTTPPDDKKKYRDKYDELQFHVYSNDVTTQTLKDLKKDYQQQLDNHDEQGIDAAKQNIVKIVSEHYQVQYSSRDVNSKTGQHAYDKAQLTDPSYDGTHDALNHDKLQQYLQVKDPLQLVDRVNQQIGMQTKLDQRRSKDLKAYVDSDQKSDPDYAEKHDQANAALTDEHAVNQLSLDEHRIHNYRPGNDYDDVLGDPRMESLANQESSAADRSSDQSSTANSTAAFETESQSSAHLKDKVVNSLKLAGAAIVTEFTKQRNFVQSQMHAYDLRQRDQEVQQNLKAKDPKYLKALDHLEDRQQRNFQYSDQLDYSMQSYRDAKDDDSKQAAGTQLRDTIIDHRYGKNPTDDQLKALDQDIKKDGLLKVGRDEGWQVINNSDQLSLRANAILTYGGKAEPTKEDQALVDQAMTKKNFTPSVEQAKSQAAFLNLDANYAGQIADNNSKRFAQAAEAAASQDHTASVTPSQASTMTSVADDDQNSSAGRKTSKAAHEASEVGTTDSTADAKDGQKSSAGYDYSKLTTLTPSLLGLSSNHLDFDKNGYEKSSVKSPDAEAEKQGAQAAANKVLDDDATQQAADTAYETHEKADQVSDPDVRKKIEALNKETAQNEQKLKDRQAYEEAVQKNNRSREALGLRQPRGKFTEKLRDVWERSQDKNRQQTPGSVFLRGATKAGGVAMKLTGRTIMALGVVATGTAIGAMHLISKAGAKMSKSLDKSVAHGFAPGDVKDVEK